MDMVTAGLRFDGRTRWVLWGSDEHGRDHVVFAGAEQTGEITDVEPAQAWLRRERMTLDPYAALGLWNWAGDVAYSTGQPWHDRGRIRDRCYDKLFAANVPWFFDLERHRPVWSPVQVNAVRAVLGQAVHVLRTGFGA